MFNLNNSEYPTWEKAAIAFASFINLGIAGLVVRFFLGPIPLFPLSELALQTLPYVSGFGVVGAVAAFRFPAYFSWSTWFFPGVGGG